MKRLRRYFFAGLVVILPIFATLWLIGLAFEFVTGWTTGVLRQYDIILNWYDTFLLRILVLVTMVFSIALVGIFTTRTLGSRITNLFQNLLHKIPFFNRIYAIAKQIAGALSLLNSQDNNFHRVVLVQYPRKGLYTLGFVTNQTSQKLVNYLNTFDNKTNYLNLFVPTTPNPTSGVFVIVPAEDVRELDVSVEDAIKLVISGGTVSLDNTTLGATIHE